MSRASLDREISQPVVLIDARSDRPRNGLAGASARQAAIGVELAATGLDEQSVSPAGAVPHRRVRREVARIESTRKTGGRVDMTWSVLQARAQRPVPTSTCAACEGGVRSSGFKPKDLSFHPGVTGEGKTGRANLCEPLVDAS